jgi:hypothetical protein
VDDPVARLASHCSEEAEIWERRPAGLIHPLGLRLLERLPTDGARVVLDLGTGRGTLLPAIAAKAPRAARSTACRNPMSGADARAGGTPGRHIECFFGAEEGTRHEPTGVRCPAPGERFRSRRGSTFARAGRPPIQAHLPLITNKLFAGAFAGYVGRS